MEVGSGFLTQAHDVVRSSLEAAAQGFTRLPGQK